jgi:hypothetical protein
MARPIKETPILYGEDSDRFLNEVKENENNRMSIEEREKALDLFKKVMAKATFNKTLMSIQRTFLQR